MNNLNHFFNDLKRFAWPLSLAGLISYLSHSLLPLLVVVSVQLAWQLGQKWRLAYWLANGKLLDPPHAGGLWEVYYTRLMHLFRHEQLAQARLKEIIFRARKALNSLNEGVVFLTPDLHINYFNRPARKLLGLVPEDNGELITNLMRQPQFRDYLAAQDFDQTLDLAIAWQELILNIKVTSLGNEGFLLRFEDITPRHQLETLKRDFVANVSHELKTPLTVFKGAVELLQDTFQPNEPTSPAQLATSQKLLTTLQQQSERMEALVANLLLLASLEGVQEPVKTPVNLSELLEKIQLTYNNSALAQNKTLSWQIQPNLSLLGVASELESAFTNLLDNALNYSPAGALIQLTARQHKNKLLVQVEDNGFGIEARYLPHLSERFYRVDKSRNRNSGGTGLGLAIVKHVLQRHQGRLVIHSQVRRGSKFICKFNLKT